MSDELEFALGETWIIRATAVDSAGDPFDLTDMTAMEFRVASSTRLLAWADRDNGISVIAAALGSVEISVPPARQAGAKPGVWRYEWWVTMVDGQEHQLKADVFTILRSPKKQFPTLA